MLEQSSRTIYWKTAVVLATVLIAVPIIAVVPTTPTVALSSNTGVFIPLYIYPGAAWTTVSQLKTAHPNVPILAVINPSSGPGAARDTNYVNGINQLRAAGVMVLGYVYTSYGSRPTSAVEADISSYHSWYAVDGIMFDEMSNVHGNEAYYSTVSAYAKSLGYSYTVGNPGCDVPASFYGTVDNIVIYENAGAPSLSFLQAHSSYPKGYFSAVAYAVSTLDAAFVQSAAPYVQWISLTNDNLPNPYDTLPSYLSSLVAALDAPPPPASVAVTVNSVDMSGNPISGMPVIASANGSVVASGFTSFAFNATSGSQYNVSASNFGSYLFDHWASGSTSPTISISPVSATTLTAYCRQAPTPQYVVSVTSADLSGGPLSGMPVAVNSGDASVASGYSPLSFNASAGLQYTVTVSGFGSYLFDHWSTGSTSPNITLTFAANASLVAYCRPSPPATVTLTVASADAAGNPTANMPVVIKANGTTVASGLTLLSFNATYGTQYVVSVSDYSGYCFDHWNTGGTSPTLAVTPTQATSLVAYCHAAAAPSYSLSVGSADLSGKPITGLWVLVQSGGSTVSSGYSPLNVSVTAGVQYSVTAGSYGSYQFDHWSTGSLASTVTLTPNSAVALTAYYRTSSPPATVSLTVKSCDLSGKALNGLLVTIKSGTTVVASGYTPLTFSATSGTLYTVSISGRGSYVFDHWATGSTLPTIFVTPSQSTTITAYFRVVGSQGHH